MSRDYRRYSLRLGVIGLVIAGVLVVALLWGSPFDYLDRHYRFFDFVGTSGFRSFLWLAAVLVGGVSVLFAVEGRGFNRRRRRFESRICQRCGYDLRAQDAQEVCPECGLGWRRQEP